MSKLSVEQLLIKAKGHSQRGETEQAAILYNAVLSAYPNNKRAKKALFDLKKFEQNKGALSPAQKAIHELSSLYNRGELTAVILSAEALVTQYPDEQMIWNILGAAAAQTNRLDEAIQAFKNVVRIKPYMAEAHYNLGNVLLEQNKLVEAIKAFENTTKINPNYIKAYNNLGNALKVLGDLDKSILAYQKAISINTDFPEATENLKNAIEERMTVAQAIEKYRDSSSISHDDADGYLLLGNVLLGENDLNSAIFAYRKAISIQPDFFDAYNNLGIALNNKGHTDAAIQCYNKSIALNSNHADAYNNLGNALRDQNNFEGAIDAYKNAIRINPDFSEAFNNLGNALKETENLWEALENYKKAVEINPDSPKFFTNMGITMQNLGLLENALIAFDSAIALSPDYVQALSCKGNTLNELGKTDAAISAYQSAISIDPDYAEAYHNMSFAMLNSGQLEEGVALLEWRYKLDPKKYPRTFDAPLWDGKHSLKNKRLLIWGEQGPGDMVIWASCFEYYASLGAHIIVEVPEKLVDLLKASFPDLEIRAKALTSKISREDFDYHISMLTLFGHACCAKIITEKQAAYISPKPERVDYWKNRLAAITDKPCVGVSWKSPVMNARRAKNYPELSYWRPVFDNKNCTFINLQSTDFDDDLKKIAHEFGTEVINFEDLDHYDNLSDVAALGKALNMAIGVSTTVAMITAAVGTKTLIPTWRQSSWNNIIFTPRGPKTKVICKNSWETWEDVMTKVSKEVAEMSTK